MPGKILMGESAHAESTGRVELARVEDVPTEHGLRVKAGEKWVALFRVEDEVFAINAICPHAGAFLDMGYMDGHTVMCPLHGWDFDVRTGESPSFGISTSCFDIEIDDGTVYLKA
jgi:nitrite reductase/ring-hydroxylating ferredoxin subunit